MHTTVRLCISLAVLGAAAFAAHAASPAAPAALPAPATASAVHVFDDCHGEGWCPELVELPAGRYTMGSPAQEPGREANEGPQHEVTVPAVAVGRFHVTHAQYAKFVHETGYAVTGPCYANNDKGVWGKDETKTWDRPGFDIRDRDPAVCVSWNDAKAYTSWLSKKTGQIYRLLSEAEYEYAARAGSTGTTPWGDHVKPGAAHCIHCESPFDVLRPAPVGSFAPNAFGLYDTLGNVEQWLEDCAANPYRARATIAMPAVGGNCAGHMMRGGGWTHDTAQNEIRSAMRESGYATDRGTNLGFRVAREL